MSLFHRRQHKLPKFPQDVAPTFKRLCKGAPVEQIPELLQALDESVAALRAESKQNPLLNLPAVEALYDCSKTLLQRYESFSGEQRALVMGAVYYFALNDDPSPDTEFVSGFDDDVQVMNYVLEEIGANDLIIDLKALYARKEAEEKGSR